MVPSPAHSIHSPLGGGRRQPHRVAELLGAGQRVALEHGEQPEIDLVNAAVCVLLVHFAEIRRRCRSRRRIIAFFPVNMIGFNSDHTIKIYPVGSLGESAEAMEQVLAGR